MFPPARSLGGYPLMAMALALGIWGSSERSAVAQGAYGGGGAGAVAGGPVGQYPAPGYGYGGSDSGVPAGFYDAPPGIFAPGYHGFGLDYGCGKGCLPHRQTERGLSVHRWASYVLGKECLYPYVADPYSDPAAALGFWPPYSAPVAGAGY